MRTLKFIIVALIVVSIVILVGIGYIWRQIAFVEYQTASESTSRDTDVITESTSATEGVEQTPTIVLPEPVTISTEALPEGQRKILNTLGMDKASYTITPEAVECAVSALGKERALQIQNGAIPTMAEGLTLIACLK